jgi:hypothetical protein
MTKLDYRNSISAPVTADDAYDKIARVNEWWAKDFTGSARNFGDKFTVRFGETFVDFEISEAIPCEKVVWKVTDCYLEWIDHKTEWNGTSVVFEISSRDALTTVTITHEGLVPEFECYNDCRDGWNGHIDNSLLNFLTQGNGQPE